MNYRVARAIVSGIAALSAGATLTSALRAAEQLAGAPVANSQPQEGILVLRDGGVLAGLISRAENHWIVKGEGREIYAAAANVKLFSRSLEEAYDAQRRQTARPTIEAHVALAEWCLRHGLLAQAAAELIDARGLDSRHPRLALVERRLAVASQHRNTNDNQAAKKQSAEPNLSTVVSGVGESPAGSPVPPPAARALLTANPVPLNLPAGTVETFTRRIQLVLVNNCTSSGCHQSGGNQSFQLDRSLLHGMGNRRSTMHNLEAALAQVNRERPQDSPLLTVPRRPHGGMTDPVFGPQQSRLVAQLTDWVILASRGGTNASPDLATAPDASAAPADVVQTSHAEQPTELTLKTPPLPPRYGVQLQSWQPKDPFDPEIFNRQFILGKERKASHDEAR
jgi:hypothetical protein